MKTIFAVLFLTALAFGCNGDPLRARRPTRLSNLRSSDQLKRLEGLEFGDIITQQNIDDWNYVQAHPGDSKDYFSGTPNIGDMVVYIDTCYQSSHVGHRDWTIEQCFGDFVVTAVAVIDNWTDGTGAGSHPQGGSNGVGYHCVDIFVQSEYDRGMNNTGIVIATNQ